MLGDLWKVAASLSLKVNKEACGPDCYWPWRKPSGWSHLFRPWAERENSCFPAWESLDCQFMCAKHSFVLDQRGCVWHYHSQTDRVTVVCPLRALLCLLCPPRGWLYRWHTRAPLPFWFLGLASGKLLPKIWRQKERKFGVFFSISCLPPCLGSSSGYFLPQQQLLPGGPSSSPPLRAKGT